MAVASSAQERASASDPLADGRARAARLGLALGGGAWALVSLPLVAAEWSWPWVAQLSRLEPWSAMRASVAEPYVVFGALAGVSFLAIGLALLPELLRAGWGGLVLLTAVLAGSVVSPLSYLGTAESSPLHGLWGAEGPLLVLVGLAGVAAAVTARGWPRALRALLAATLLVLVAGTLALGYYPHGPLVALALEAAVVVLAAPRRADGAPERARPAAAVS
ncbi:hypothetical protein [Agrococcus citreus]|uniref:DUF998 domain-containing protein n=1 Tax=Agrococcus citreus TaxID=84643 RepID=A0ABN1YZ71_9MICO